MKKIIFAIFTLIIFTFQNVHSQSGWFPLNPVTYCALVDIKFVDPNTGVMVSYTPSLIFRTTNGGTNWTQIPYNAGNILFYKVLFVDNNTGWIVGSEETSSPANVILKTTNSGLNWFLQYQGTGILRTISFINTQTGWVGGTNLLKTTNAGTNWIVTAPPGFITTYNLQFIDQFTGWVSGLPPSTTTIIKTTDGGGTWFTQLTGTHGIDVCFVSAQTGFCGTQGGIMKTTNGGTNWIVSYSCDWGQFFSFVNLQTGWAVIQNGPSRKILKTTNAGNIWTDQGYTSPIYLNDIFMYSAFTGWAVGHEGVVYKTTNGGEPVGIKTINSEIPEHYSLFQNYPNPFNPSTKIRFDIAPDSRLRGNDNVTLIVFDVLGREAIALVNQQLKPGSYEAQFDGTNYPSGIYFYTLTTATFTQTRKMVLIK